MPGRSYTAEAYRYGYQGSEKDNGLAGGTDYTTFFRALDPRIGRWMTPDPKVFPWQSPYCSMDCNPVALIDPWGAETIDEVKVTGKDMSYKPQAKGPGVVTSNEPSTVDASALRASNPASVDDGRDPSWTVNQIFIAAGGDKKFNAQPPIEKLGKEQDGPGGIIGGKSLNRYTNNTKQFVANDEIDENNFVIIMIGHFKKGTGPENWVFDEGSKVSEAFKKSRSVEVAIDNWYEENWANVLDNKKLTDVTTATSSSKVQPFDIYYDETILSIANFVGSCLVKVTPSEDGKNLIITASNVTSLTSGDYGKELPWNSDPTSIVRYTPNNPVQTYSNVSQTFKMKVPISKFKAWMKFLF